MGGRRKRMPPKFNREAMAFLADLEELVRLPEPVPGNAVSEPQQRGRGRPATIPEWERPVRTMSPRQLARNDLIETAQNWSAIVARKHAECITATEAIRQRGETVTRPSADRAERVRAIAGMLTGPNNSALNRLSDSNIAARIEATFPDVNRDTLRKDVAKARKLARLT